MSDAEPIDESVFAVVFHLQDVGFRRQGLLGSVEVALAESSFGTLQAGEEAGADE